MKPFLGIDVTVNKKNDRMNGDEFLVKSVSGAQSEHYDQTIEEAEKSVKRAEPPLVWSLAQGGCGLMALGVVAGIIESWDKDLSLNQMYANAPALFWLLPVCVLVWLTLTILSKRRAANVSESREVEELIEAVEAATSASYTALGVPEDAAETDVLCMIYKLKNGEPVPKAVSLAGISWLNAITRVFTAHGSLCIADAEKLYAIPLSSLRGIRTVNTAILIPSWNKEIPPNEEPYKRLKLAEDNMGRIRVKPYYILDFDRDGESWGLYFPNYELATFESLTGLNAQTP